MTLYTDIVIVGLVRFGAALLGTVSFGASLSSTMGGVEVKLAYIGLGQGILISTPWFGYKIRKKLGHA